MKWESSWRPGRPGADGTNFFQYLLTDLRRPSSRRGAYITVGIEHDETRRRFNRESQTQGRAVTINNVSDVSLPGGKAVVVKYTSNSGIDPVTNKQVRLENETYVFSKNGKEAMLTVWAPQGADNADQWQRMAKSFRWQ